jgi:hypothetical protein
MSFLSTSVKWFFVLNFETNFKEQHSRKYIGENDFFVIFMLF